MGGHGDQAWRSALILAVAGLTSLAPAFAQPFPPEPPERSRAIGDWLVTYGGTGDGGRMARMTRVHDGFILEYYVDFWRGNQGPYSGARVELAEQRCGDDWRRDAAADIWGPERDAAGEARRVRTVLADALVDCGARSEQVAASLRGFDHAFALAQQYAEIGRVATLAEIDAIVNTHDPGSEQNADAAPPTILDSSEPR